MLVLSPCSPFLTPPFVPSTLSGFLETIKTVQPAGRWKIVVVDSRSLKILSSACRMYDILEENVRKAEQSKAKQSIHLSSKDLTFSCVLNSVVTLFFLLTHFPLGYLYVVEAKLTWIHLNLITDFGLL